MCGVCHLEIWPDDRCKQRNGQLARVAMVPRKKKVDGSTTFDIDRVVVGPAMLCCQVPATWQGVRRTYMITSQHQYLIPHKHGDIEK